MRATLLVLTLLFLSSAARHHPLQHEGRRLKLQRHHRARHGLEESGKEDIQEEIIADNVNRKSNKEIKVIEEEDLDDLNVAELVSARGTEGHIKNQDKDFKELVKSLAEESELPEECIRAFLLDDPQSTSCQEVLDSIKKFSKITDQQEVKLTGNTTRPGQEPTHKRHLEEEVAVENIHKGEFEPVSDMLMALPFRTAYARFMPLMSALITGAFIANVNVDISNTDRDWDAFKQAYKDMVQNGLNGDNGLDGYYQCLGDPTKVCMFSWEYQKARWATKIDDGAVTTHHDNDQCVSQSGEGLADYSNTNYCVGTIWMRDYGPLATCPANPNPDMHSAFVYHDDRVHDNRFPDTFITDKYGAGTFTRLDIIAEGGNIQTNGAICLCSNYMYTHNFHPPMTIAGIKQHVRDELEARLGCTTTMFLTNMRFEGTHHVDMYITWLAADQLIMGQYQEDQDPGNEAIIQANIGRITTDTGIVPVIIPMPSRCPMNELPLYLNALIATNGVTDAMADRLLQIAHVDPAVRASYSAGIYSDDADILADLFLDDGDAGFKSLYFDDRYFSMFAGDKFKAMDKAEQIELVGLQTTPGLTDAERDALLAKMHGDYGTRYSCPELDVPNLDEDFAGGQFVYRSYTNGLVMNGVYVMPIYERLAAGTDNAVVKKHQDDMKEAIKKILAVPGINDVVTGYADAQIAAAGAAHCTTQTIRRC